MNEIIAKMEEAAKQGATAIVKLLVEAWEEIPAGAKKEAAHALVSTVASHVRGALDRGEEPNGPLLGVEVVAAVQSAIDAHVEQANASNGGGS